MTSLENENCRLLRKCMENEILQYTVRIALEVQVQMLFVLKTPLADVETLNLPMDEIGRQYAQNS